MALICKIMSFESSKGMVLRVHLTPLEERERTKFSVQNSSSLGSCPKSLLRKVSPSHLSYQKFVLQPLIKIFLVQDL